MNQDSLVSVIVPIYKVEAYLDRCVNSILKQTYKNIEIILVDDGSPDGCGKKCDEYEALDSRVKVIHKINGGLSDARNVGFQLSQGDYITFIDSDDYVAEYMISEMLSVANAENCKLVQCEFEKGKTDNFAFCNKGEYVKLNSRDAFETRETKICVCGKLYSRDLIQEKTFRVGKINEDEFYTYQCIYESGEIVLLRKKLYYYFQQSGSIMHTQRKILNTDMIEAYNERIEYFKQKKELRLCDITQKEKCIREILLYMRAKGCEDEVEKRKMIRELFVEDYRQIRTKNFDKKEKLLMELYYRFPRLTGNLVQKVFT